ncbi:MAG: hypothetical protein WB773_03875, partial [Isosphaeraceae bacterium]
MTSVTRRYSSALISLTGEKTESIALLTQIDPDVDRAEGLLEGCRRGLDGRGVTHVHRQDQPAASLRLDV